MLSNLLLLLALTTGVTSQYLESFKFRFPTDEDCGKGTGKRSVLDNKKVRSYNELDDGEVAICSLGCEFDGLGGVEHQERENLMDFELPIESDTDEIAKRFMENLPNFTPTEMAEEDQEEVIVMNSGLEDIKELSVSKMMTPLVSMIGVGMIRRKANDIIV
ncbi:unnamed protein product [Caenorhabditis sp. 36 PRJEB53466]|nr:unnamed protein product [Caenorhabditis sp. 36 PRJEB53466]